jgi:hypothetical protein
MPHAILQEYHDRLARVRDSRQRMEALFGRRRVTANDVSRMYESLFVHAVTGFERFCERWFFEVVSGRIEYPKSKGYAPRIKRMGYAALRAIVYQTREYLDWLPYDRTQQRAKNFMGRGGPFCCKEITQTGIQTVGRIYVVRNVIAHSSRHSLTQFKKKVLGGVPLLPRERTPAGFLRSRLTPTETRFEAYLGELAKLSAIIHGRPQ